MRIGHGFDAHRLVEGRPLVLGGVTIPYERGLDGHSDADVLVHAVMDALLGAAGLGDIGAHFPPDDPQYKDISSLELLRRVEARIRHEGYLVGNLDITILAQAPKLARHFREMRSNLSENLGIDAFSINLKATTEEGMGYTGRGEGISAHAVCLLVER